MVWTLAPALATSASRATQYTSHSGSLLLAPQAEPSKAFTVWLGVHGKDYANNYIEYSHRLSIFQQNVELIRAHNEAGASSMQVRGCGWRTAACTLQYGMPQPS